VVGHELMEGLTSGFDLVLALGIYGKFDFIDLHLF
jgi:hypothetical protein